LNHWVPLLSSPKHDASHSLKGNLCKALMEITISKDEIKKINPNAVQYFHFNNHATTEDDDGDAAITKATDINDDKLLPILFFKLFPTSVSYGISTKCFSTKALVIKCNINTGEILHKLFLHVQINKNIHPCMQYMPIGAAQLLSPEPYQHLIMQNNTYFQSLAIIPVLGFTNTTLNYLIMVNNNTPGATHAIHNVLKMTDWCLQIKPIQTAYGLSLPRNYPTHPNGCSKIPDGY